MFHLIDLIELSSPVRILDLGAKKVEGHSVDYEVLIDLGICEVVGFDAIPGAIAELSELYPDAELFQFYPNAVGDGEVHTLYVCKSKARSSLFRPNVSLCSKFDGFAETLEVITQQQVQTIRLDDIPEIGDIDFIKSDIQGSEVAAIHGGASTFRRASVVEVEVEFVEQYVGQPLFADVDSALRDIGFVFHTFLGYGTRPLRGAGIPAEIRRGFKQWLWANAVYLKDLHILEDVHPEKLLKMAVILHEVYQSYDFAHYILSHFDKKTDKPVSKTYRAALHEHLLD